MLPQNFWLDEPILMILFFIWKLLLPVWSPFVFGPFLTMVSVKNHINPKFALGMCATNGRITQYHANRFRWFFFYWKTYTSRILWLGSLLKLTNHELLFVRSEMLPRCISFQPTSKKRMFSFSTDCKKGWGSQFARATNLTTNASWHRDLYAYRYSYGTKSPGMP